MRALRAACSFVAAIWFRDATYNHHRLTAHVEAMLCDMRRHSFRCAGHVTPDVVMAGPIQI